MKTFETDVDLAPLTSFRIGGPAERLFRPRTAGDAAKILDRIAGEGETPRILGGGTNLLVDDEPVRRPVIHTAGMTECRRLPGDRIRVEAGCPLHGLLVRSARWGLAGLEGLAGIPGTVGGAVFMNAGGGGVNIADRIESVDVVLPGRGPVRIPRADLRFGYRRSGLAGALVLAAVFRLDPADPGALRRRLREVARRKRAGQPLGARSAGCFFRNPGKIPAGLLIDRAGLKGCRIGGAMVSDVHANFLVNVGEATARDVMRLAAFVRDAVWRIYGVRLRAEVKYWRSAGEGARGRAAKTRALAAEVAAVRDPGA